MNEISIHGNVAADPTVHHGREKHTVVQFTVGVTNRWYNRAESRWETKPTVWHKVVCFGELGENVAATVHKGTLVTVTGTVADDSYTPDGRDQPVRRQKLEAADVAVSLRWATATVVRSVRDQRPATVVA